MEKCCGKMWVFKIINQVYYTKPTVLIRKALFIMEKKYWVPALERANDILQLLASEPSQLKLIDLAHALSINKSSMFSLLHTLETLGFVVKEKGGTYSLGPTIGALSAAYFRQFHILQAFYAEAPASVRQVQETVQLSVRNGRDIIYLAKEESLGPLRVATDAGMRFPAYATAMGKVQLSALDYSELKALYPEYHLEPKTPWTVGDVDQLWEQLQAMKAAGYGSEQQEAVTGFFCIAAPVYNHEGQMIASVSFTMLENAWKEKADLAKAEIVDLGKRLSRRAGHVFSP
jgi:IclR family KDG regulon transcriptional repressor